MSTTNQMMSLSAEIGALLANQCSPLQHRVSDMKIKQLGRLTRAATLLYLAAAFFTLSGLLSAVAENTLTADWSRYILVFGVVVFLLALILLILYGFQTIRIRRLQHFHNHEM